MSSDRTLHLDLDRATLSALYARAAANRANPHDAARAALKRGLDMTTGADTSASNNAPTGTEVPDGRTSIL